MKKTVSFMKKDSFLAQEMQEMINFLTPLFENDNFLFKEMIRNKTAYLDGKRFTYILDQQNNRKYRLMGNCIGPVIYIRDVLTLNDPDTALLND